MIYVVFFVTLLLNSVKTSTDGGACNETWQKYSSNNYRWKAWWGGATDEVEEDTWIWESGKPLPLVLCGERENQTITIIKTTFVS